ncbi:MAG: hypothetical protein AAF429_00065 [Pseudomonadota bacterium]
MIKWLFIRILISAVLVVMACVVAGAFGMVHNQLSFAAAPTYFFDLKFYQFRIPSTDHNAWGAALVGWQASWWMGGLLGLVLVIAGFRISAHKIFAGAFVKIAFCAVLVALTIAICTLFLAQRFLDQQDIPEILNSYGSSDPLAFFHAAVMHEASYYGSVLGLVIGYILIFRPALKRDRKIRGM